LYRLLTRCWSHDSLNCMINDVALKQYQEDAVIFFVRAFEAVTGNQPYLWQRRLFWQLCCCQQPSTINLPTGTGKTSILHCWIFALAFQVSRSLPRLPRRLCLVVNRRAVVDQATREAELLLAALSREELRSIREALASISLLGQSDGIPLVVSTLRGQFTDNRDWSQDPSRAAIILGTPDMIGSRLLAKGYGDGKWWQPQHAGLLGCDTLLILDEAFLSPAFAALIRTIQQYQEDANANPEFSSVPTISTILMSAVYKNDTDESEVFGLTEEDFIDQDLQVRLRATKQITLPGQPVPKNKLCPTVAEAAKSLRGRVLIYVERPKDAVELSQRLSKKLAGDTSVLLLTGRLRGKERDDLAGNADFQRFLRGVDPQPNRTTYLICTSAGEVGVDFNGDTGICDLVSADAMLQRFGRYNRAGRNATPASIQIVVDDDSAETHANTMKWLVSLANGDVSPWALYRQAPPKEAMRPEPLTPELQAHQLDGWFLTSLKQSDWLNRPKVESWIHGKEQDLAETSLVWRNDAKYLVEGKVDADTLTQILGDDLPAYPIAAAEKLTVPTYQICGQDKENLLDLLEERQQPVIWRGPDGTVEIVTADQLGGAKGLPIKGATLILPTQFGGLEPIHGYLDLDDITPVSDVSYVTKPNMIRAVLRVTLEEETWIITDLESGNSKTLPIENYADIEAVQTWALAAAKRSLPTTKLRLLVELNGNEAPDPDVAVYPTGWLLYFSGYLVSRRFNKAFTKVPLSEHNQAVADKVRQLAEVLQLPPELADQLVQASRVHDIGKAALSWQQAFGNLDQTRPLAKTGVYKPDFDVLSGLRHELLSLSLIPDVNLPGKQAVAAHHGWARPGFNLTAGGKELTPEEVLILVEQSMERYALQVKRYGWWRQAWLESLLRAADALVSAEEEE
jgi:CRISPR-associated endonuclease/helicase Cas3